MSDLITDKALEIVNALQNALMAHGGEAVQLGLNAVKIDCIRNMIFSFLGVVLSFVILCLSKRYNLKIDEEKTEATILVLIAIVIGVVSFWSIFDTWHWVGIFDPKLYLAHQVIGKVVN